MAQRAQESSFSALYTVTLAVGLSVIYLVTKPRKATQVENVKTREQVRVERLHAQRAARRKGGSHEK